jgi:hypothetical protein
VGSYLLNDNYLAYMLRLKRSADNTHWRATLEDAHSGAVWHFAAEEELFLFLMDELARRPSASDLDGGPDQGPSIP